jgi:prevent-host-death family protein
MTMVMPAPSKDVPVSSFKARCLELIRDVSTTGREIVITHRGQPVARVVPFTGSAPMQGSVRYRVDEDELLAPIDEKWQAAPD